jgi:hypothetical protein
MRWNVKIATEPRKGQFEGIAKGDVLAQNQVINQLFGLTA